MHRRWLYFRGRETQRSASVSGSGLWLGIIRIWSVARPHAGQLDTSRTSRLTADCHPLEIPRTLLMRTGYSVETGDVCAIGDRERDEDRSTRRGILMEHVKMESLATRAVRTT